ncbi:kinase-like domain-containing protein [Tirmania nivea]|nr:kinase-like domain-containing protein [Tirmania nivea]
MAEANLNAQPGGSSARSKTFPAAIPSQSETNPMPNIPSGHYSPLRHHKRTQSMGPRAVKETLDACLDYGDEDNGVRVNQYSIKQEIGRGSYGAVHLAVDQSGQEYAMKEFSKSRLRKRSQSNILRRPHQAWGRGSSQSPLPHGHRRSASQIHSEEENGNPLYLIREEIAIMKKLGHENIIKLYEVLDDPDGDSLYMVMEYCPKGVVMKVGLGEKTEPYTEEQCRLWFRDMILGIEYLHSQGIIHRDIKPDNLILTEDYCLKIVDFGVSEFFKKGTNMFTGKSAGSPAFLPPELCKVGHGEVSGEAADVWSMGVTLYCLCFGCLPFNYTGVLELYDAIRQKTPELPTNEYLKDLLLRLLDKNPETRIKIRQLREHPWVTRHGKDNLLSYEENTTPILIPTEEELNCAITKSIRHVMTIVKAVNKLKALHARRAARGRAFLPAGSYLVDPPVVEPQPLRFQSLDENVSSARYAGIHLAAEGVHSQVIVGRDNGQEKGIGNFIAVPPPRRMDSAVVLEDSEGEERAKANEKERNCDGNGLTVPGEKKEERVHTHSHLDRQIPFLCIEPGKEKQDEFVVNESPTGTDGGVYEEAYKKEVERIKGEGKAVETNSTAEGMGAADGAGQTEGGVGEGCLGPITGVRYTEEQN